MTDKGDRGMYGEKGNIGQKGEVGNTGLPGLVGLEVFIYKLLALFNSTFGTANF